MKLVLNENIRGLGSTGDVIEVKDGYGRNYLLPKKLALPPTDMNIQRLRKAREGYLLQESGRIESAQLLRDKSEGLELEVEMKANDAGQLFGSITEQIVATAASAALGVEIRPQQIILGAHYKRIGDYSVVIRLHSEVEVELPLHVKAELSEEEVEALAAQAAAEAAAAEAAEAGEGEEGEEQAEGAEGETVEAPAGDEKSE